MSKILQRDSKSIKDYKTRLENIRTTNRIENKELRKQKRNGLLSRKRARVEDAIAETRTYTLQDVKLAALQLEKDKSSRLESLRVLRRAFTQCSELPKEFLRVENALQCLVGILSGSNPDQQIEAIWCVSNLASTGCHSVCLAVVKLAAPYLITYLNSSSPVLQDHSAWAIGNLAADDSDCQAVLILQGALAPVLKLIKSSTHSSTVQSAVFALTNLTDYNIFRKEDCNNILDTVLAICESTNNTSSLLNEIHRIIFNITSRNELSSEVYYKIINQLSGLLSVYCQRDSDTADITLLTGCIRSIGTCLACVDLSGIDHRLVFADEDAFLESISKCLDLEEDHLQKETLWLISNMTDHKKECQEMKNRDMLSKILALCNKSVSVSKEALICLCNICTHGEPFVSEVCMNFCQHLRQLLLSADLSIVEQSILLTELLLFHGDKSIVGEIQESLLMCIEQLYYHQNISLQEKINYILQTYS